jgi:hypothetical protein
VKRQGPRLKEIPIPDLLDARRGIYNATYHMAYKDAFDLSSASNPMLSFTELYKVNNLGTGIGTISIEASTDGVSWNPIDTRVGVSTLSWENRSISLSSFNGNSSVLIRFVSDLPHDNQYWQISDITVCE